jgi:hypothetical protein
LSIPLTSLRSGSHALVCVFLSVISNDWQLEVLSLEAEDHQDNPHNKANEPYKTSEQECKHTYEREITNNIKDDLYDCETPKEEDRLHGVETHKSILLLHQEKDEASYPAKQIAQSRFNVGLHTHRGRA